MDADALLRLAAGRHEQPKRKRRMRSPCDGDGDAVALLGLRRGQHGKRKRPAFKSLPPTTNAKQFKAQAISHDKLGFAKTADSYMHGDQKHRKVVKGRSRFRRWTPEAVLRVASSEPSISCRSNAPDKTSGETAIQCKMIVANCIAEGQDRGLEQICTDSRAEQLLYVINNTMFDETKLPFGKHRRRKLRCLAWHSQVTSCRVDGEPVDNDVFRPLE